MKNLIKDVKLQLAIKSLVTNGSVKNIHLKVKSNVLDIGEITVLDNSKDGKCNFSFNKESGGNLEFSGNHDSKLLVKNLSILGNGGEEFSMESMEFNCIGEAMELFASILK